MNCSIYLMVLLIILCDLCIELYSFNVCAIVMLNFMQEFILLLLCSYNGYSAQNEHKSALIKVSVFGTDGVCFFFCQLHFMKSLMFNSSFAITFNSLSQAGPNKLFAL